MQTLYEPRRRTALIISGKYQLLFREQHSDFLPHYLPNHSEIVQTSPSIYHVSHAHCVPSTRCLHCSKQPRLPQDHFTSMVTDNLTPPSPSPSPNPPLPPPHPRAKTSAPSSNSNGTSTANPSAAPASSTCRKVTAAKPTAAWAPASQITQLSQRPSLLARRLSASIRSRNILARSGKRRRSTT